MSITIGDITKRVKSNKQNIKINLNMNHDFEQNKIIKKRVKQNLEILTKDDTNDNIKGDIIYNENEVINIPKKLDDLFDNLLCDIYYLYGIPINDISFLNSLLYILLSEFKFKNAKDQLQYSNQLKINLKKELPDYFKNNKYSKLNYKKQSIEDNIENNIFENAELHYLSDYYSINLIILDYYKFTYYTGSNYNENNNNIIIIKYNDIYLPMIHIFGESPSNLIYKCIINKLKINNLTQISKTLVEEVSKETLVEEVSKETLVEEVSKETLVSKSCDKLKALSSYKLFDLQEMCKEKEIPLLNNGKNKTKKQLYDALIL